MSEMAYVCGCVGGITACLLDKVGFMLLLIAITNRQEDLSQYYQLVLPPSIYWKVVLIF